MTCSTDKIIDCTLLFSDVLQVMVMARYIAGGRGRGGGGEGGRGGGEGERGGRERGERRGRGGGGGEGDRER